MGEEHVVINTKQGKLRGQIVHSAVYEKSFYAFRGIPYAKPPIEELRFKAPQPSEGWEGVKDALEDGHCSLQAPLLPVPGTDPETGLAGGEDCLYLNVYFNELPESKRKKPVMFSIHGGGFSGGSGDFTFSGPDYLMNEDVVVVAINYRCGALGFLSLETDEVPGNAGMKDQVLALKWVRDNIDSFGGDPENVTIFGISAGGASVDLLLLSPLSKGLFHKAIIQSGFSTNPWATQPKPRERAVELARALGCVSDNANAILKHLQSVPAAEIIAATKKMAKDVTFMESKGTMFVPCVEVTGAEPFLEDSPANLLKRGQFHNVPVILGCVANEGSVLVFFDGLGEKNFDSINKSHKLLVPSFLGLEPGSAEELEAANDIWQFYMKGKPVSWDNVNDYITYQSDFLFNIGMEKTRLSLLTKSVSPVFSYYFTNHTKMCFCSSLFKMLPQGGNLQSLDVKDTCHGADCMFIYCLRTMASSEDNTLSPDIKESIVKHVKVWTTFASTGDPSVKELGVSWEKDSNNNPHYMDIGPSWAMRDGVPFTERIGFWKNLCSKFGAEF